MKNIAVLAGGYTSERQISLNSGSQILENIDRNLYNAYLVDVRKDQHLNLKKRKLNKEIIRLMTFRKHWDGQVAGLEFTVYRNSA